MVNKSRLVALFLASRLFTFMVLPPESLLGFGDFVHFFKLASLPGWPFFQYWVEFPPIFPFLSSIVYRLAGGQQHVYLYIFLMILTLVDTGNLLLFARFADRNFSTGGAALRKLTYLIVLMVLPYCWWYFDPLAVFCMMLGINLMVENRVGRAGVVLGIGFLVKLFPIIALLVGWKRLRIPALLRAAIIAVVIGGVVFGAIWITSPGYGRASILSQSAKGSWETVWALIDGNFQTGAMAAPEERTDLASVGHNMSLNPARIPPVLTLVIFGAIGLWAIWKLQIRTERQSIQVLCFAWGLFMLWSPGFSPQWILYLIPLILLSLPEREGFLFTIILILICLAEWPLLLSQGMFWTLIFTVPVRFILIAGMSARVYQMLRRPQVEIG
jgi:hypothetical protein